MFRSFVLLSTLGVVLAHGGGMDFKSYSEMKIMKSCVGEQEVTKFFTDMMAACQMCKTKERAEFTNSLELVQFMQQLSYRPSQYPSMVPVYYIPNQQQGYQPYPQQQQSQFQQQPFNQFQPQQPFNQFQPQQPFNQFQPQQPQQSFQPFQQRPQQYNPYQQQGLRAKRSPKGLRQYENMADMIEAKVSNMTCVLQALNYIDAENNPNYSYAKEWINSLQISEGLKQDFMEGHEFCREFSMCLPTHQMKNPVTQELGTPLAYMKCFHMKKIRSCMREDQRKFNQMFGGDQSDMSTIPGFEGMEMLFRDYDENDHMAGVQQLMKLLSSSPLDL